MYLVSSAQRCLAEQCSSYLRGHDAIVKADHSVHTNVVAALTAPEKEGNIEEAQARMLVAREQGAHQIEIVALSEQNCAVASVGMAPLPIAEVLA